MVAFIGSGLDVAARQALGAWPEGSAIWIALEDITGPGWRIDPADPAGSVLRAGGKTVRVSELTGVVMTMDLVHAELLHTIVPEDRAYLAQEIEALLTVLCAMVNGPVVNAPFRAGYQRRRLAEEWAAEAARSGISCTHASQEPATGQFIVRVHPEPAAMPCDEAQAMTTSLALASGTPFLCTTWRTGPDGPCLAHTSTHPFLHDPAHARAVRQVFTPATT